MDLEDSLKALIAQAKPLNVAWPDHLVPSKSSILQSSVIRQYLGLVGNLLVSRTSGSGELFVVCLPSFRPEWAITCELGAHSIVLKYPQEPIWPAGIGSPATVESLEASIDPPILEQVEHAWRTMLSGVRPFQADDLAEAFWASRTDGETYVFGHRHPHKGLQTGEAWSPHEDTRVGKLVMLGKLLQYYVMAPDDGRIELANKIRQAAEWLGSNGLTTVSGLLPSRPSERER